MINSSSCPYLDVPSVCHMPSSDKRFTFVKHSTVHPPSQLLQASAFLALFSSRCIFRLLRHPSRWCTQIGFQFTGLIGVYISLWGNGWENLEPFPADIGPEAGYTLERHINTHRERPIHSRIYTCSQLGIINYPNKHFLTFACWVRFCFKAHKDDINIPIFSGYSRVPGLWLALKVGYSWGWRDYMAIRSVM